MNETSTKRHIPKSLCWAIVFTALVRLVLFVSVLLTKGDTSAIWCNDSSSYVVAAQHLITTGRFASDAGLELARTPGYPVFLVPGLLLGRVEIVTVLLQIVVSCATTLLVYATARQVFGRPTTPILAAWLYALEPMSVVYCAVLLSETLFTFLLLLSVYLLTRFAKDGSSGHLCAASLVLAMATYVRPITYFLPVLLGLVLCLRLMLRSVSWQRAAVQATMFVAIAFGLTGMWQVRNYAATGYSGFSSITDRLVYHYQAAAVIASQTNKSLPEVQAELGMSDFVQRQARDVWESDAARADAYREIGATGRKIIQDAPFTYALIHIRGCVSTFLSPGAGRYVSLFGDDSEGVAAPKARRLTPLMFLYALLGASCAVYYLLSFAVLLERPRRIQFAAVLALVVFAYLVLASGGPSANSRFRHPMMPLVSMTAAAGFVVLREKLRRRAEAQPQ
jgi:4-amino-4-deoxy-L-arabinose transferase-like glycosyltransferase